MGKYDDIIRLPRHVSHTHAQMPVSERAAQFSSFAALSGYEDAVAESGRLTGERIELDCDATAELDEKLRAVCSTPRCEINVTYFVPDAKKAGGSYVTLRGRMKKIDEPEALLIMENGKKIPLGDVIDVIQERMA